ncbi:hypothetical protein ACOJBO_08460 [Rhizobium beringeri]
MLTRMLSVSSRVPEDVANEDWPRQIYRPGSMDRLCAAGREAIDKKLVGKLVDDEKFSSLRSDARFEFLVAEIRRPTSCHGRQATKGEWRAGDASVRAEFKATGKTYSIALKSEEAATFGRFITDNLERLHQVSVINEN